MDPLFKLVNQPIYKAVLANQDILRKKVEILDLVEKIRELIDEFNVTGKKIKNAIGDIHFEQCPEAYYNEVGDTCDFCVCGKIHRLKIAANNLIVEVEPDTKNQAD